MLACEQLGLVWNGPKCVVLLRPTTSTNEHTYRGAIVDWLDWSSLRVSREQRSTAVDEIPVLRREEKRRIIGYDEAILSLQLSRAMNAKLTQTILRVEFEYRSLLRGVVDIDKALLHRLSMAAEYASASGSELMSSIAAVRQLLTQEYPSTSKYQRSNTLADELSAVQQSRYEDRLKFEEERKNHQGIVDDLKLRVEQVKREAQQEKFLRLSLEETNDALEKHKEELSAQLDELSFYGAGSTSQNNVESGDSGKVQELEKEKVDLSSKLSESRKEVEEARKQCSGWKSQCLASQRQVKELHIQIESYKKQYEASQDRQKELLQGQDSKYQSFQIRLEESVAARKKAEGELKAMRNKSTISESSQLSGQPAELAEMKRKFEEANAAKVTAEEKVAHLESEIEALKRGKSEEEIELEQEKKAKVEQKVASLYETLDKMQKQAEEMRIQAEKLEKESSSNVNSANFKNKKQELSLGIVKVGAVLESVEVKLKEKLALAKVKVEDYNSEFNRVREELSMAKQAVTSIQNEVIRCQQKQKELSKAALGEHSAYTKTSNEGNGTVTVDEAMAAPAPVPAIMSGKERAEGGSSEKAKDADESKAALVPATGTMSTQKKGGTEEEPYEDTNTADKSKTAPTSASAKAPAKKGGAKKKKAPTDGNAGSKKRSSTDGEVAANKRKKTNK